MNEFPRGHALIFLLESRAPCTQHIPGVVSMCLYLCMYALGISVLPRSGGRGNEQVLYKQARNKESKKMEREKKKFGSFNRSFPGSREEMNGN